MSAGAVALAAQRITGRCARLQNRDDDRADSGYHMGSKVPLPNGFPEAVGAEVAAAK